MRLYPSAVSLPWPGQLQNYGNRFTDISTAASITGNSKPFVFSAGGHLVLSTMSGYFLKDLISYDPLNINVFYLLDLNIGD